MADNLTNYAEDLLLKWLLTAAAATRPTQWHVALSTTATDDTGSITEPVANGYARVAVTFGAPTAGQSANTGLVSFGPCTGVAWGNITHVAVFDAPTGGNMLLQGALAASKNIGISDKFEIDVAQLAAALT